jgi:hypothetical protein
MVAGMAFITVGIAAAVAEISAASSEGFTAGTFDAETFDAKRFLSAKAVATFSLVEAPGLKKAAAERGLACVAAVALATAAAATVAAVAAVACCESERPRRHSWQYQSPTGSATNPTQAK